MDFLLAPEWHAEKLILRRGFLCLTLGYETDEGVVNDKAFTPELRAQSRNQCMLSTRTSRYPSLDYA